MSGSCADAARSTSPPWPTGSVSTRPRVLLSIDDRYEDQRSVAGLEGGVGDQLVRQLSDPRPADTSVVGQLPRYEGLAQRWHDWDDVRAACAALAAAMLDGASS